MGKGVNTNLCKQVKVDLAKDLKEIDCHLREKFDVFKLACDYPKGDGDSFKLFVEEDHPDQLLRHVESTNGNAQDALTVCTGSIYFNAPYCMECLDQRLWTHKKSNALE